MAKMGEQRHMRNINLSFSFPHFFSTGICFILPHLVFVVIVFAQPVVLVPTQITWSCCSHDLYMYLEMSMRKTQKRVETWTPQYHSCKHHPPTLILLHSNSKIYKNTQEFTMNPQYNMPHITFSSVIIHHSLPVSIETWIDSNWLAM